MHSPRRRALLAQLLRLKSFLCKRSRLASASVRRRGRWRCAAACAGEHELYL